MKTIRQMSVMLFLLVSALFAHAADAGTEIMKRCADKFRTAPSVTVDFAVAHNAGQDNGTLTMCKDLFKIATPALSIWYDGTTQWTYLKSNNEVNITEPTGEELMESNPFELINSFANHFNCRAMTSSASSDIVELTPKSNDSAISSAKITISKSTGWPTAMVIVFDGGATTSVSIRSVKTGAALVKNVFKFDSKTLPGVEVVDLR